MGLQFTVQYKKGIHNGAVDALSRKPVDSSQLFTLSTTQPAWLISVLASYDKDPVIGEILQKLTLDSAAVPHYTLHQGLLRFKNRIMIGPDVALQKQLISALHDSPQGGHSGFPVTYKRISSLFKWPQMKAMVKDYVKSCMVCQQAKPE